MSNEDSITLNSLSNTKNSNYTINSIKIVDSEKLSIKNKEIELLYGNDINIKHPRKLGNLKVLYYSKNDYPLIILGPDCII